MKILINTPSFKLAGGVANHYMGLRDYWNESVNYNVVGKRREGDNLSAVAILPYDIIKFILKILIWKPDVVLLNPSMAPRAIKRDFVYLKLAKILGRNVAVMFHGFNTVDVEDKKVSIVKQLNRCSVIFVLAGEFRKILKSWGVTAPVELTTTKVENKLIEKFDINTRTGSVNNVLYLARVTKPKGIFVALDVFKKISEVYPRTQFTVVGDGEDLKEAIKYATNYGLENIRFTGALSGDSLKKEFSNADLYVFTSYHEGMPTSVLEAMAFGLPIITRPLGGLVDFFKNEKMGYIVDSDIAEDYIPAINKIFVDPDKTSDISVYNHNYAVKNFLASSVAKRMEEILRKYI